LENPPFGGFEQAISTFIDLEQKTVQSIHFALLRTLLGQASQQQA